jgi:hypothetical protein
MSTEGCCFLFQIGRLSSLGYFIYHMEQLGDKNLNSVLIKLN